MNALVVEPMRKRDLKKVLVIESTAHPKPWSASVFASELDLARRGERYYAVGRMLGDIVAYGGLMFVADEAHVTNVAVEPELRQRGLARAIMCHLAEVAIERGAKALTLEVRVSNVAAQRLYREFGFAPAGVRQRYYENSEDALVMWAHDIDGDDYRLRLAQLAERPIEGVRS